MAESPYDTILEQPLSADPNLDALLQNSPQSNLDEMHSFRQPATGNFGLFTPQATHLLANDTQSLPPFETGEPQMSPSLATSAQAQNFFIHSTSILKASFLKTPTPSMGEISRLAAQTGLDQYDVSTWFDIIRSLKGNDGAKILPTPEVTQAILPQRSDFNVSENSPPPPMDSNTLRTIDRRNRLSQAKAATRHRSSPSGNPHPSKRQRKGQSEQRKVTNSTLNDQAKASRRRPSKALGENQYCCPTCKFQTGIMDQWYTHQSRKHFPLEVFICGKKAGTKPCKKGPDSPCKRKDNFVTHLKDSHGYQLGEALNKEVSKRTVKVTGLFHDKCGFCSKTLDTREASMNHIGAHIESGDNVDDWFHQCTSLDHKLESILDEPELEVDSSNNNDGPEDEGYTDQDNFRDWTQGGDYDADDPVLPLQSLVVQRTPRSGSYGTIPKVRLGNSRQSFALKTIGRTDPSSKASQYRASINEDWVMTTLRHPHIVELLGSYIHPDCLSLLMAPVADTNLSKSSRVRASLGSSLFMDRLRILIRGMSSIAAALNYIHSPPVCQLGDRSFHKTLKKTNDWTRMLIEEQRRRSCSSDQDHHIPLDMIHEMLSEDPNDRPMAREIWLPLISDSHSAAPDEPTSGIERPSKSDEGSWSRRGPDIQSGIKLESLGDEHGANNLYGDAAGTDGDWLSRYASTSNPTGLQKIAAAHCGEARTFRLKRETSWSLYPDLPDSSRSQNKRTRTTHPESVVDYPHSSYIHDKELTCRFPGYLTFRDKRSSYDYFSNFNAHGRNHDYHSGSYI